MFHEKLINKKTPHEVWGVLFQLRGGPELVRTAGLRNANATPYQLSHRPQIVSHESDGVLTWT